MKSRNTMNNSFMSSIQQFMNSDVSAKYDGMVRRSPYKKFRSGLLAIVNHAYSVCPKLSFFHLLAMFFRITQFLGCSLLAGSKIWPKADGLNTTVSIISIFYHVIPLEYRDQGGMYFLGIYIGVLAIYLAAFSVSAIRFKKTSNLPYVVSFFLYIFLIFLNFFLHPIALTIVFETLSKIIFGYNLYFGIEIELALSIISFVFFSCYFWFYANIHCQHLSFRPASFMSVMIPPQIYFFSAEMIVNVLTGFSIYAIPEIQIFLLILTALVYAFTIPLSFSLGGFIKRIDNSIVTSSCVMGALMCIVHAVLIATGSYASYTNLVVYIGLFFVVLMIFQWLFARLSIKRLMILDIYEEKKDLDIFKSISNYINCCCDGMYVAHPIIIKTDLLKAGSMKWDKNRYTWFIYAKFVAIYPEESVTLTWIYHSIIIQKIKGLSARAIKSQSTLITKRRETALSPTLKVSLNRLSIKIQSTKYKLRNIWDIAIKGSLFEMESAIRQENKQIQANIEMYTDLFRQYPNNRFITRSYARFNKEVIGDQKKFQKLYEASVILTRGMSTTEDQIHMWGLNAIPTLPKNLKVNETNIIAQPDYSTTGDIPVDNDIIDSGYDYSGNASLLENIETLSIPSIKKTRIIRLFVLLIVFVVPISIILVWSTSYVAHLTDPIKYLHDIATVCIRAFQIAPFLTHYIYEQLHVYPEPLVLEVEPVSLGSSFKTRDQLSYLISRATSDIQDMNDFQGFDSSDRKIDEAKSILFDNNVPYFYYPSLNNSYKNNLSVSGAMSDMISSANEILNAQRIDLGTLNSSEVLQVTRNMVVVYKTLNIVLNLIIQHLKDSNKQTKITAFLILGVVVFLSVVIISLSTYYQMKEIHNDKFEAYKCLTSIPKSDLIEIIENDTNLTNTSNSTVAESENEANKQYDMLMKTLMTGDITFNSRLDDRSLLLFGSLLIGILEIASVVVLSLFLIHENEKLIQSSPHLAYFTNSYGGSLSAQYNLQLLSFRYNSRTDIIPLFTTDELEKTFSESIVMARNGYQASRFGGGGKEDAPFYGYQKALDIAYNYLHCDNPIKRPSDFMEMVSCYNVEGIYILIEAKLRGLYIKTKESSFNVKPDDYYLRDLWSLLITPIFDGLFFSMFNIIIPTIQSELKMTQDSTQPIIIALLVVGILFEGFAFAQLNFIEKHIRETLKLLLHAPLKTVMTTPKIAAVLNGNFKSKESDASKHGAEYYENIYDRMKSKFIVLNKMQHEIVSLNKELESHFGINREDFIGKSFRYFMTEMNLKGDIKELLDNQSITPTEAEITGKKGSKYRYYIFVSKYFLENLSIEIIDVTEEVMLSKVIEEECQRTHNYLKIIIPDSIIDSYGDEEKQVAYKIRSTSIVYINFVKYSDWSCTVDSLKAIKTLSRLYEIFDNQMKKYPSLMRYKAFGDTYIAASGLFDANGDPNIQAREAVNFALDVIDTISANENGLQVRIGIDSGGPINEGLVMLNCPSFEVFGQPLAITSKLQSICEPMCVMITLSTFELLGDAFETNRLDPVKTKYGVKSVFSIKRKPTK